MKKVLFPIIALLAMACTVGIYYLLFDQETSTLFYVNTIVTCVAELILLLNIPLWSGKKLLTVTNATVAISLNVYAIAIFLWTLFFTLAIYDAEVGEYKMYYIGMLVATLIFVVVCGMSAIGANTAEKMATKEQQASVDNRKNVVQFVRVTALDITSAIEECDAEWKEGTERLLRTLVDKVASMPIDKLQGNPDVARRIEEDVTELATVCEQLASAEDRGALQADITSRLNRLNRYVTTIKTM